MSVCEISHLLTNMVAMVLIIFRPVTPGTACGFSFRVTTSSHHDDSDNGKLEFVARVRKKNSNSALIFLTHRGKITENKNHVWLPNRPLGFVLPCYLRIA